MPELKNLRADPRFAEILCHIEDLASAQCTLQELLIRLDEVIVHDRAKAAGHLTFIRVEVYFHLLRHIRALRKPLYSLIRDVYAEIGEEEPPAPSGEDDSG